MGPEAAQRRAKEGRAEARGQGEGSRQRDSRAPTEFECVHPGKNPRSLEHHETASLYDEDTGP